MAIIGASKGSTSVTITADGIEPMGYDSLPTLTASIPIADISEAFHWSTGLYLIIVAAILYITSFVILHRYRQILEKEDTKVAKKKI